MKRHRRARGHAVIGIATMVALGAALAPAQSPPPGNVSAPAPIVASASVAAMSRQRDTPAPGGMSARNASYDIDVTLDHATRTLSGSQTVRWRNIGHAPVESLRLQLYWNGWRNTASTWLREEALAGFGSG